MVFEVKPTQQEELPGRPAAAAAAAPPTGPSSSSVLLNTVKSLTFSRSMICSKVSPA